MKQKILIGAILLLGGTAGFSETLELLKSKHEFAAKQVLADYTEKAGGYHQKYREALDKLLVSLREKGELERTLVIMEELNRFDKDPVLDGISSPDPTIQKLLDHIRKAMKGIDAEKNQGLVLRYLEYEYALEKLQGEMVRSSQLEDAMSVKTERDRVKEDEAYVAARQYLRENGLKMPVFNPSDSKAPEGTIKPPPREPGKKEPPSKTPAKESQLVASKNLVVNPGNEQPCKKGAIPGWDAVKGKEWYRKSSAPDAKEGKYYFFAGEAPAAELAQTVDVTAYRDRIARGIQKFRFEAYVSSWKNDLDRPRIIIEFLDPTKTKVLDSYDSGAQRSVLTWIRIFFENVAHKDTHFIRIRLICDRFDGNNNDGYFDAIELCAMEEEAPAN